MGTLNSVQSKRGTKKKNPEGEMALTWDAQESFCSQGDMCSRCFGKMCLGKKLEQEKKSSMNKVLYS